MKIFLFLFLFLNFVSFSQAELTTAETEFFENKVRPVLANECYKCHSIEHGTSKGGLTLDSKQGMLKGGESGGPILIPGDPDQSLMIQAIRYDNPDLQMPAKYKLKEEEIEALTEWVRMGAPDPRKAVGLKLSGLNDKARTHWAYQKVNSTSMPSVKNSWWGQSPVDQFIMAKLEENKMSPSHQADKETLIRRAYYDLIGLPPTPKQIESFKADKTKGAFATVVDELLNSPQYGERWGRHWLDTVRYSDTIGSNVNLNTILKEYRYPYAWSYRDYVINSFNEDKPYNRFILEQLAADQLPDASQNPTSLAALGFLTVGEKFMNRQDEINEKIDTVSKSLLSLTVSCARCHDHPFDPIPTTDYYAFHGIFNSITEPDEKPLIGVPVEPAYSLYLKRKADLEKKNQEAYLNLVLKLNERFLRNAKLYLTVVAENIRTKQRGRDRAQPLPAEINTEIDNYFVNALTIMLVKERVESPVFTLFKQLAALSENEFERRAPEICSQFLKTQNAKNPLPSRFENALTLTPIHSPQGLVDFYAKLFAEIQPTSETEIRRLFDSSPEGEEEVIQIDPFVQFPLAIHPASTLNTESLTTIIQSFSKPLEDVMRKSKLSFDLSQISYLALTDPGSPARAMVVKDVKKPADSPVFIRGQAEMKGEMVPRRFLAILSPEGEAKPFREGSGRLELAKAIADPKNPITARAMVNRVWMWHFGSGIVSTPDNLGTQSEAPSHPELLDYLADYFIENGWSIKALHRLIMLSSVYQQNSDDREDYSEIDPQNKLLWRANIRRLDFESIRDSLISFGGTLNTTIGGKPVNLVDEPYSNRRSVYGYIDRGNLPELMAQFDFSNPDASNSQRNSTIVPQQSLFFMNSPMIIGVVRNILERPEFTQKESEEEKIVALYQIVLQRTPQPREIELCRDFLNTIQTKLPPETLKKTSVAVSEVHSDQKVKQKKEFKTGKKSAIKNEGSIVQRTPLNKWETFTQSLIFLNETIYVN